MTRRAAPSLEDTGIPRARKGEALPATEVPAATEKASVPMFLKPGHLSVARKPEVPPVPVMETWRGEGALAVQVPAAASEPLQSAPAQRVVREELRAEPMRLVPRKAQTRGEPRSPVTTRLTYTLQDRLFAAATQLGQTQQQIVEDALDAHLSRYGI